MKKRSNVMKKFTGYLAIVIITCMSTISTYAITQGQNSIGDIGVDITWYDFDNNYTNYYLQDDA